MSCKYLVIKKCMKKRTKKATVFSFPPSLSLCLPRSLIYAHCSALGPRRLANGKINTFYGQPRDLTVLWAQAPSTHTHIHRHRYSQLQLPDLHTHCTHTNHTRPVHFAEHKLFDLIESENEFAKCPKRLQSNSARKPLEWPLGQLATYATCA